jgi:hypothetical protein
MAEVQIAFTVENLMQLCLILDMPASAKSISQVTQHYIRTHPAIQECLLTGIVNMSALARLIGDHYNLGNFTAVLAACQRYARRGVGQGLKAREIVQLVLQSQINVKGKITTVGIVRPYDRTILEQITAAARKFGGAVNIIQGEKVTTIIVEDMLLDSLRNYLKGSNHHINRKLASITLTFPKDIETTPGVVAYVCALLAVHNINIRELISCADEFTILIDKKDVSASLTILSHEEG